jgi:hypothetical protein
VALGGVRLHESAVKKRGPSSQRAAKAATRAGQTAVLWLALVGISTPSALARSWSYHYRPGTPRASPAASASEAAQSTPVPADQLSTARVLKRAIVSNLALFVQEQTSPSDKAYAALSENVVRKLSLFDQLGSPDALGVLASLSGYYLGARGTELYRCLVLRKGKALAAYLEQYLHNGNPECSQELGPTFTKPSSALDGYALCPSDQLQKAHLATLIAAIYSESACSDSEFAALSTGGQAPSAATR